MKNKLIEKYGAETILYDIAPLDIATGTIFGDVIKEAGYIESPSVVIGQNGWWNLTVAQLVQNLTVK